jgi:hypothetical protein
MFGNVLPGVIPHIDPVGEICTGFHVVAATSSIIEPRKFNLLAEIGNVCANSDSAARRDCARRTQSLDSRGM